MFYGTGANQKSGPIHGDTLVGCADTEIASNVDTFDLFYKDDFTELEGIDILLQDGTLLEFGTVSPAVGQVKRSSGWRSDGNKQFFGFESVTDFSTGVLDVNSIGLLEYSQSEFERIQGEVELANASIALQNANIAAANQATNEQAQRVVYDKVIRATLIADLPKPSPRSVSGVLYPEVADALQVQVNEEMAQIDEERFQVANQKRISEEQAATEAIRVKGIYDQVIDELTVVPDYSGHTDADREENAGAIAAVIIGVVIMLVFVGFLLYNYMMKKKAREMNSARNG